ncbi:MAG: allophanate hydrolase [Pseudomonadales bacterium]|nr:allophanate hydrolase [Pseudomonadales bacterium]
MEISSLSEAYSSGELNPEKLLDEILNKIADYAEHNIWIRVLTRKELQPYLNRLKKFKPADLPLYGIPFAIKDNIDLAGIPTTAACEAFTYVPEQSAAVVELLINAGAIPIGKTNLDQFATGLVGVRSPEPWGVCKNAFNKDYISGGSSSGSAVAVALGLVSFSLGTDTAGSGRVPAAFNNLVGLKPSRGLLSTRGVVPACRSLDCVSIFSLTADDAKRVFECTAHPDELDAFSRSHAFQNLQKSFGTLQRMPVVGVISAEQLETYGDHESAQLYQRAIECLAGAGFGIKVIDFQPFREAARLLYEGPWVAERFIATGAYLDDMLEVTRSIIGKGDRASAVDAFKALYQLQVLKKKGDRILAEVDCIMTPTTPGHYLIEAVLAEPVKLNSQCGEYTNFMNLMDYSALAVPMTFRENGLPNGITLFSMAFDDLKLLSIANTIEDLNNFNLGASPYKKNTKTSSFSEDGWVTVAVCGAHLEGLPLNGQLTRRNGYLLEKTRSAACYRFYALAGGPPFRPGLMRSEHGGAEIEVELWRVPAEYFGSFVAGIPAPLGMGKIELADGRWVNSFICEGYAVEDAEDITRFGSWRNYMASKP